MVSSWGAATERLHLLPSLHPLQVAGRSALSLTALKKVLSWCSCKSNVRRPGLLARMRSLRSETSQRLDLLHHRPSPSSTRARATCQEDMHYMQEQRQERPFSATKLPACGSDVPSLGGW
jgi:hypothetical protein